MREKREQEIRNILKGMQKYDVTLAHLEMVDSMAVFIRDDDHDLGAFESILLGETEDEYRIFIVFNNGVTSRGLIIMKSTEDQRLFQMFCSQKIINTVYVNANADIHRVVGSMNPLYGRKLQS